MYVPRLTVVTLGLLALATTSVLAQDDTSSRTTVLPGNTIPLVEHALLAPDIPDASRRHDELDGSARDRPLPRRRRARGAAGRLIRRTLRR